MVRELGSGGGGIVYLAEDRVLHDRPVVLKFLFPGSESRDRLSQRFRAEIEALARIRHPGVVGALDAGGAEDGRAFLVMEFVEGVTLRTELSVPMAASRVASLIRRMSEALTAAHQAGVLHRDLKPENVMLQRTAGGEESVKLIDFGVAKIQHASPDEFTRTISFVGTINYVAPEQLLGQVSVATDIYSLGVMAYEMLAGRRPFDPSTPFGLYEMQKAGGKAPPSRFRRGIPPGADAAVMRALSFDPTRRQTSPEAFARELAEGLSGKALGLRRWRRAAVLITATLAAAFLGVRVKRLHPTGLEITMVAGGPTAGLGHLHDLASDKLGNIYFSAPNRQQVFKVAPGRNPRITLVAGNGSRGWGGDGGDPAAAQLNNPLGLAVDTAGDLYIVNQNNQRIRKVNFRKNTIETVAGSGVRGFSGDGGDPLKAEFDTPFSVSFDAAGRLYISDQYNDRIRMVQFGVHPVITTVVGSGAEGFGGDGGDALRARLWRPCGIALDSHGNLYIADQQNNRIRKVTFEATPVIETVVGTGLAAFGGDGGDPTHAQLAGPPGLAVDPSGVLYIADENNHRIRRVTFGPKTVIQTIAGNGTAGSGGLGGQATQAALSSPSGVAIGLGGKLFIADYLNDRILQVDLSSGHRLP